MYFILHGLNWGVRSGLRLRGRGFGYRRMEAPTFQMLHAGRAGEGSFLHHLSREDRSINLHPQFWGCTGVKVCFWGLYFVRTTRLSPKKALLLKSPAFLDLWREPVWKQLLQNLFSVTFTYRELTRVLLRTTWPSHTKGKREFPFKTRMRWSSLVGLENTTQLWLSRSNF